MIATAKDQKAIKTAAYKEAIRYVKEAKTFMKKAPKDKGYDDFIRYKRDLRKICNTAYKGMSVALDAYLKIHNIVPKREERSNIYYMQRLVRKIDIGLSVDVYSAHNILRWGCCEDGMNYTGFIEMGFENVMEVINKIKPTARGAAL